MLKKILITLLEIALIALVVIFIITALNSVSFAEEEEPWEAYVICQPGDYVNVRYKPSKRSQIVGYAEAGDPVLIDGTEKHGFLKCYGIGEYGEGWIHKGFVVNYKPEQINRTAIVHSRGRIRARRWINGKRRAWLKNQDEVKVYWCSDDWCVTNKGFVKTKYLEME